MEIECKGNAGKRLNCKDYDAGWCLRLSGQCDYQTYPRGTQDKSKSPEKKDEAWID